MKDEDWMKDAKTGEPLKWVIVKVRKIIEQEIPICVSKNLEEKDAKKQAIELMKKKTNPFGNMGFFESQVKTIWEYE